MSERIYPGTSIEVLDGNLSNSVSVPRDVCLIMDTATTGPVGRLYSVQSAKTASTIYGSDSRLIKSMQRAFLGGAKNVALYRIGGRVASIDNIFGLGSSLETTAATASADLGLAVYIGPEPINPALDAVIVYKDGKIVYSNVLNSEIDLSVVSLTGFSKVSNEVYVGSFQQPVPFSQVRENAGLRVSISVTDSNTITIPPSDVSNMSAFGLVVKLNGSIVEYTKVGGTITVDSALIAPASTNTLEVSYVVKYTAAELLDSEIKYTAGQDLVNSTWKELYEGFDAALNDIQSLSATSVYLGELFNVPNIANGDTDANRLEYLYISEDEDGEKTYEWSTSKFLYRKGAGTTTVVSEADLSSNGLPVIVKQYNEVDFVHRAGMWAFETTSKGYYPNIVVGASGPVALTTKYITRWIGKAPTYNLDGKMITNGTGLLGHRYMVGTTTRQGGYFATDSGYPDGTPITDSNNFVVDLGKYISVVVSQVVSNTSVGEVTSGAANYAGLITSITPGDSTTNQVIPGTLLATSIKEGKLRELQSAGYVVFEDKPKGVTVVSGNLATRLTSDFRYVGTSLVMNILASDISEVCDPFIGKGIDGTSLVALQGALISRFADRQRQSYFINFLLQLQQTAPNVIDVAYVITAKDELRTVTNTISLARQINTVNG